MQIIHRSNRTALLGVVALEEARVLAAAACVLRRHHVPLVVAAPRASDYLLDREALDSCDYSLSQQPDNIFSAVPNTAAVARATIAVARGIQSSSVRIVGSGLRTLRTAERAARQLGMSVDSIVQWTVTEIEADALIDELPDLSVVALLMEPQELALFMNRAVRKASDKRITYLLGCVSGSVSPSSAAQWALDLSSSAFLIEPHLLELAGLSDYFQSHGIDSHPLDSQIPHIVQAVSALGAAFHLQELSNCVQQNSTTDQSGAVDEFTCNRHFVTEPQQVPSQMLSALRQLSMPTATAGPQELEGMSNHFTPSGRLVAHRYLVKKLMAGSGESSPVAWYSDDDGLVLAAVMTSQSRFDFFGHASSGPLLSSVPAFAVAANEEHSEDSPLRTTTSTPSVPESIVTASPATFAQPSSVFVHGRTWAASILAVSATTLLAALYITAVLLSRCCDGTLRPAAQTLSFLLLASLMAQLSSVCLFVLPVQQVSILALKLFIPPLCLAAVYALLLAKLLEFRNLASAGLGGSVPQCPLYIAVLLAVAVQAAVSAHFYIGHQLDEYYLPLLYLHVTVLAVVTASYATTLRQIRSKQTEAQLILVASLASSFLLLLWALAVVVLLPRDYHDALTAVLIVLLAITVLASVYVPRVVQLNRQRSLLDAKSTYACNIASAHQQLPVSPWLDCTFACQAGKFKYSPPAAPTSTSVVQQQRHLNATLSGRSLLRHPAYSMGYSGQHLN